MSTESLDVRDQIHPKLDGFALVLGASSGFGEACSLALSRAGMGIVGVHLDRRAAMGHVEEIQAKIRAEGVESWFHNVNAVDDAKRKEVLDDVQAKLAARGKNEKIRVLFHSLAFGSLLPMLPSAEGQSAEFATRRQIDMTLDVMANSLVYWTQDLVARGLLHEHGRIFAMTSTGSWQIWPNYGVVCAAKAALESHVRVLAAELGPRGVTANALCAGVTDTPAQRKIPGSEAMVQVALRKNPSHRLTTTQDVARAVLALSQPCIYWMNGNTINIDGGEAFMG